MHALTRDCGYMYIIIMHYYNYQCHVPKLYMDTYHSVKGFERMHHVESMHVHNGRSSAQLIPVMSKVAIHENSPFVFPPPPLTSMHVHATLARAHTHIHTQRTTGACTRYASTEVHVSV